MATIGLRDLFAAQMTIAADDTETYGTPFRLAKAISAELSVTTAAAMLYADDAVDETINEFVSGTLTLTANDLTMANQQKLLGQALDAAGVLFAGGDDNPPYFAIGFRAKRPRGDFRYVWLLKCKFTVPSENYETKGDNITFTTPQLTAEFITRGADGKWKADFVGDTTDAIAQGWFTAVPEFTTTFRAPDKDGGE